MKILGKGRNNGLIDSTEKFSQAHLFQGSLLPQQQPSVDPVKSGSRAIQMQVELTLRQKGCSDISRKDIWKYVWQYGKWKKICKAQKREINAKKAPIQMK